MIFQKFLGDIKLELNNCLFLLN